jgi:hypothetical protein
MLAFVDLEERVAHSQPLNWQTSALLSGNLLMRITRGHVLPHVVRPWISDLSRWLDSSQRLCADYIEQ